METMKEGAQVASHDAMRAAATESAGTRSSSREFLSFHLGTEEYGIDLLKVQEIRSYEVATRIVNAPDFVKGVVNLRGIIVPIVDLRLKFALEVADYNQLTVAIVLNVANRIVGVVVDSVSDVVQLGPEQIKPAPGFDRSVGDGFIMGIGSLRGDDGERLLILLDIERLMSAEDMGLGTRPPADESTEHGVCRSPALAFGTKGAT